MLRGFTIGVTADRRWDEQVSLFDRRGAAVQHGPSIRTLPLGDDDRLRAATDEVISRRPALLIANTGLGIRSWFSSAELWGKGDELAGALREARIFARGPKAAGAAQTHGLEVEVEDRAATERLCDAVDLAIAVLRPGDLVALQLDGRGSSIEVARLRAAGADVLEVPVYEWELPEDTGPAVRLAEAVVAGRVHAVTFTAGPAIRNWFAIADANDLGVPLRAVLKDGNVVVGCVGPVCAESAMAAGLDGAQLVVPRTWRLGPLVRAVSERLIERTVRIDVGGTQLAIAGNLVTIGDVPVLFTDTEAQVLTLLAARPNVVHAKADLLRTVWRDEDADPHVVEVAVARLRRRMGALGGSITSVYRRGYTLKTEERVLNER